MKYKNISIFDHVGEKAGMDYYSSSLAKGFISNDYKCTIYSNYVGLDFNNIKYKKYFDGHTKSNLLVKMYKLIVAIFKSTIDARIKNSNLIIVHLFSANIVTMLLVAIPKLFGLKTAIISHDVSSFIDNDNKTIQHIIYNILTNYIIVHNKYSYNELLENVDIDRNKVHVIKHGGYLDYITNRLSKKLAREQLQLEQDGKYILFFGQIKDVKGLDILLESMQYIDSNIKLIIAGKPWKSDFTFYDTLIKKYNLESRVVKMIGFVEDNIREKLFFAADVNILPYRVIYQSGVLLMAMSYQLPVITSNLPANKEIIIDEENGLLFNTEDSKSLAEQIEKFFSNDILAFNLKNKALATIKNDYDWNKISNLYINILKN